MARWCSIGFSKNLNVYTVFLYAVVVKVKKILTGLESVRFRPI
jgi:hypothetical protein